MKKVLSIAAALLFMAGCAQGVDLPVEPAETRGMAEGQIPHKGMAEGNA